MAITLDTSQGSGNSADPSSSVVGTTVNVVPRLTVDEGSGGEAGNVCVKLLGAAGTQPTIVIPTANFFDPYFWGPYEWGYFSYDQQTWTRMGNAVQLNTPSGHVTLSHNANFTGDVWIARDRREGTVQINQWVNAVGGLFDLYGPFSGNRLIWDTAPGISVGTLIGTYSNQTDELGRTVVGQHLYGFIIGNTDPAGSGKPRVALISGVQADEDWGTTCYRKAIEWLLSSASQAIALRNKFDFICMPLLNCPGRDGGHFRGQFEVTAGTHNNINRHYSDTTNLFQAITLTKFGIEQFGVLDCAAFLDYHTYADQSGAPLAWYAVGSTLEEPYASALNARVGGGSFGAIPAGTTCGWALASHGALLSQNLEFNSGAVDMTDGQAAILGQASLLALNDLVQAGYYGSTGPTGSLFARAAG